MDRKTPWEKRGEKRGMRLLVSVRTAGEAAAALAGGADLIDAKEPAAGALGAVSLETLSAIQAAVGGLRPVSAALGDAAEGDRLIEMATAFARAGTSFLKLGFAGTKRPDAIRRLLGAAVQAVSATRSGTRVVAVAYADADRVRSLRPADLLRMLPGTGAAGFLVDTADKRGPGLTALANPGELDEWTAEAHRAGLFMALAGQLGAGDLDTVRAAGADIAGVRGAACEGGRNGRIDPDRVRLLRAQVASVETEAGSLA